MEHNTKKHIEIKFDGSKLRDIMYKHDLTPMTFSKKIGLSQPAISHWLCGRNRPSRKALDKLNDYFHVTDEYWKKGVTGAFTPTVVAREEAKEAFDKSVNPHEADKERVRANLEKLNYKELDDDEYTTDDEIRSSYIRSRRELEVDEISPCPICGEMPKLNSYNAPAEYDSPVCFWEEVSCDKCGFSTALEFENLCAGGTPDEVFRDRWEHDVKVFERGTRVGKSSGLVKELKAKKTEIQGLKCELEGLKVENARLQGNIEGLTQQLLLKSDEAKEAVKASFWKRLFA